MDSAGTDKGAGPLAAPSTSSGQAPSTSPGQAETGAEAGAPAYRWVMAATLVSSNWSMTITNLSLGLLLPAIRASLDLSDLEAGWLSSAMRLGNVFMGIPAGIFLSRFNPLRLSILSTVISTGFTVMHGAATSFFMLLAARLGFGLSWMARSPSRSLIMQQWFPLKEIPFVNGIIIGLTGVAEAFTLMVTPIILEITGSWRETYFIFAGFSIVALLMWVILGKERHTSPPPANAAPEQALPFRLVFKYPEMWWIGLGAGGVGMGWGTFATFWPTYMLDVHGFSLVRSGFLLSLISLATVPSSIALGYVASRMGHRRLFLCGCGALMAASFGGMMSTTNMATLVACCLAAGLAWSFIPLSISMPFEIKGIKPREIAVGSMVIMTVMTALSVTGPILAGAISDMTGSLYAALMVTAATPLTLVVFSLPLRDRRAV